MTTKRPIIDDVFGQLVKPKLYSKTVVLWFSFFFSPLVGGILMLINLNRINKLSYGVTIFLASLVFALGTIYAGSLLPYQASSRLMVLLLNLAGANLLSGPVWKNAIGKLEYDRANPWLAFALIVIGYAMIGIGFYVLLIQALDDAP